MNESAQRVPMKRLWTFFLPLGISASLVTISHVIINGTLARAPDPETIIASYAVAMSLLTITERPAVLLRQTCSALVRDRTSFSSMLFVGQAVFVSIMALGFLVSYTSLGEWIFMGLFGVSASQYPYVLDVYRVLMFVSVFSGIRCLYQGVIIFQLRTKWLTIGMVIRLAGMYLLSLYFIRTGVTSGRVGAIIFLAGMMIEAAISFAEGRRLIRRLPAKDPEHTVESKGQVFSFYRPLLLSAFITVWIGPTINAWLGKTGDAALAIASFAIAGSLVNLVTSFFSYFHQIVLNFYKSDPGAVRRFTLTLGFVPALLIAVLAFTPVGEWLLEHAMAVRGELRDESLSALRAFIPLALVMPWLDALNGLVMVRGQTKLIFGSQAANLGMTVLMLVVLIGLNPSWNGAIGALAQSFGLAAEFAFVGFALRRVHPIDTALRDKRNKVERSI